MSRSIEDIDRDIAQVKAEIALKNKYEQGFNQPQTRVGWSSYIAAGDPNVLKMYQDRENAYKNMMKQQEFQAEQNELNRQNAEKLANMSRGSADAAKIDEWTKGLRNAEAVLKYYEDAVKKDNAPELKRELAKARSDVQYFRDKLGMPVPETQTKEAQEAPEPPETPENGASNAELDKQLSEVLSGEWTNANRESANAILARYPKGSEAYKLAAEKIKQKGDTKEEKEAKGKAAAAARDAEIKKAASGTYSFTEVMDKVNDLSQKYPDIKFEEQDQGGGKYTIKVSKK